MREVLTVGKLREALKGVSDDLEVILTSDSGVDQGYGEIVVEDAYKMQDKYFCIYANDTAED